MEFRDEVLNLLAELCEDDVVKENPDIEIFEEGLLDSFGTVNLLIEVQERFGISIPISEFDREEWKTPNLIVEKLAELR